MSGSAAVRDVISEGYPLQSTVVDQIGAAAKRLDDIATEMATAKSEDTARYDTLKAELHSQSETLEALKQKHDAEVREAEVKAAIEMAAEAKAALANIRTPSMATRIGSMKADTGAPRDGDMLRALMDSRQVDDLDRRREAKAQLASWGRYSEADPAKATLGSTDATGGWILPNASVDDLIKPGAYASPILQLVTTVRGLNISAIDIPFRKDAVTRAVVVPWGDTKTNISLAYNGYTATMYTLAQVYDISAQFARKSAGAAEQDVMQELTEGLQRGVAYYIFQGSGSSEPSGINRALITSPPFTPTVASSHTAATTTVAGNLATAVATAAGALEARNRRAEAVLLAPAAYWAGVSSGADAAGFYISPAGGAPGINAVGQLSIWGIPVFRESEYLAGADDMIIGQFSALKVYFGDGPRFDSSDVAGERFDKNLIGFRGELEMAFDARSAVYAGALQIVADVVA